MENVDVGLGLGLSAQLNDAQGIARLNAQTEQNRMRIGAQQAQQEAEDYRRIMDDLVENGKFKQHRLVVDEAVKTSKEAVDKAMAARASGNPNWRNQLYTIRNEYNNKMSELSALTMAYNHVDKMFSPSAERNLFVASDVRRFQSIYNTAKSREELVSKAKEMGLTRTPYVAVQEDGLVDVVMPAKMDVINQLSLDGRQLSRYNQKFQISKVGGGTQTEELVQPLVTKAEAAAFAKKNNLTEVPRSVEDMVDMRLAQPEFREQFAAVKGIDPTDETALKEAAFNEIFAKINVRDTRNWYGDRNINVYGNTDRPFDAFGNIGTPGRIPLMGFAPEIGVSAAPVLGYAPNVNLPDQFQPPKGVITNNGWRSDPSPSQLTNPAIMSVMVMAVDEAGRPLRYMDGSGYISNGKEEKTVQPAKYKVVYHIGTKGNTTYFVPYENVGAAINNIPGSKESRDEVRATVDALVKLAEKISADKDSKTASPEQIQQYYNQGRYK